MSQFFKRVFSFPIRRPLLFGLGFSCIKTSFADFLVQKYVEGREELDVRRNFTFGLFGLFYLGGVQYAIYVPGFRYLFPKAEDFANKSFKEKMADKAGIATMLKQTFLDQFVHHPFIYFPSFYMVKEVVNGGTPLGGLKKYGKNYDEDCVALWKVWVPATLVNFTFSPMWARIPFVASVSLLWTCILSAMRGGHAETTGVGVPRELAEEFMGSQGRALSRIFKRRKLDPTMAHVVLTATGPDRIGIVADITQVIMENGGNISESKMMRLGGDFALMCLVSVDRGHKDYLKDVLHCLPKLQIATRETTDEVTSDVGPPPSFVGRIRLTGKDTPGLIFRLSKLMASKSLNIEKLKTEDRSYKGDRIFMMECTVSSTVPINEEDLREELEMLAIALHVAIELDTKEDMETEITFTESARDRARVRQRAFQEYIRQKQTD